MGKAAVRADFDALRRHLGIERADAIGWSNGAMNLILLASERPDTLSSTIFLHGIARFSQQDMEDMASSYPELIQKHGALQHKRRAKGSSKASRFSPCTSEPCT